MIAGVLVVAAATLFILTVAGRLHARMIRARITHPAAQPAPTPPPLPRSGVAELIDALGPERPPTGREMISASPSFPERFRAFVLRDGSLDLLGLIEEALAQTGYEIAPVRGDLIARRGDDVFLIRVLPWDGTFKMVGNRTVERFAADFRASGATAGICITEAHVPPLECNDIYLIGRGRILRLLEALDGTLRLR